MHRAAAAFAALTLGACAATPPQTTAPQTTAPERPAADPATATQPATAEQARRDEAERRRTNPDGPITPDWFDPDLTESPDGFYATCAKAEGGSLRTVRGIAMQFAKQQLLRIPKAPDPTEAEYEILRVATHRSPDGRYTVWLLVEIRPIDA